MLTIDQFQVAPTSTLTDSPGLTLRWWYNISFLDVDDVPVLPGGSTPNDFFIEVNCSVSSGVITIPAFDVYTTLDANVQNPQSINCTARFYSGNTAKDYLFSQWVVPSEAEYPGGVITFAQLTIYNTGANTLVNPPANYFTQSGTISYFNTLSPAPNASALIKGITKLSIAPASATNPIAVGDNDPRINSWYNVKTYGALGDGSTNDTTAIQAAIDACGDAGGGVVYFPPGTYKVTGLTVVDNYVRLWGDGWISHIAMSSATGNTILFSNGNTGYTNYADATYLTGCGVGNILFQPSVTRTSGSEVVGYRYNKFYLENLAFYDSYQNLLLGRVGDLAVTAFLNNITMFNYKFGVKCVNAIEVFGDGGGLDKHDVTTNTYSFWISGGCSGIDLTNWDIVNSVNAFAISANNFYALYIHDDTGGVPGPILSNKFTDCYFDSHTRGVFSDAVSSSVHFTNCWVNALGTNAGSFGIGVTLSTGANDYEFVNCDVVGCTASGYYLGGAGHHAIIGGSVMSNNRGANASGDPYSSGIYVDMSGGMVRIEGVFSGRDTALYPSYQQEYGIWLTARAGNAFLIRNNDLLTNNTGGINNLAGISTTKRISGNVGYITENSGNNGSIAAAATTQVITHGLSATPNGENVYLTPTVVPTNAVQWYITATSSTTFTVTLSGVPGVSGYTFGWQATIQ